MARMADVCEHEEKEVVIVGAGIAGLATALALRRVGVRSVLVLERTHELRSTGAALSLFPNAWRALDALGVAHKLTPLYAAFRKGYVTDIASGATQEVLFTSDRAKTGVRAVHRRVLLETLAEELSADTIRFSSKIASIKTETLKDGSSISILNMEGGTIIKTKVLIGCDGVHSTVAEWLGLDTPVDSGRSAVRGLAVYPEGHGLEHAVHQFLGDGKRGAVVPMNDKEIYWFITNLFTYEEQEMARDPELILKNVLENMAKEFPAKYLDVVRHSDPSTLSWAPLLFRLPWSLIIRQLHKGCVTVAGDAMHPMTPDLGQGGCAALEDAVVLGRNIGECVHINGSVESKIVAGGIEKYVKERRWRGAGLITRSYLAGWVQQGGSGWWGWMVQLFRNKVFYRYIQPKIVQAIYYDCGDLPKVVLE